MSENLFDAGAVILSDGVRSKTLGDAAIQRAKATVSKASSENLTLGDLFKMVDKECWSKQRRYATYIQRKQAQVSETQKPFFKHDLPNGQVWPHQITTRVDAIRAQPGVSVAEQKDVVTYSFIRRVGDTVETVHHVVTKETNPAHPAIIFMSSLREGKDRPATQSFSGSFAGSKRDYEGLYQAFVAMNQAR